MVEYVIEANSIDRDDLLRPIVARRIRAPTRGRAAF